MTAVYIFPLDIFYYCFLRVSIFGRFNFCLYYINSTNLYFNEIEYNIDTLLEIFFVIKKIMLIICENVNDMT